MVKHGEILKEFIKSIGDSQEDFSIKLGYKTRQGLTYHFKSEILDNDLISKLKKAEVYEEFIQYAQKNNSITCTSYNPTEKPFVKSLDQVLNLFYVKTLVERKIRP